METTLVVEFFFNFGDFMKIRDLTIILLFLTQLTGCSKPFVDRKISEVEAISGLISLGYAGVAVATHLLSDDGGRVDTNDNSDKRFLKMGSVGYEDLMTEADSIKESDYTEIFIKKDNVLIYFIPSLVGEVLINVYTYDGPDKIYLAAIRESRNWVEVEIPSGDAGWVLKEEIDFSKSTKRNQNKK